MSGAREGVQTVVPQYVEVRRALRRTAPLRNGARCGKSGLPHSAELRWDAYASVIRQIEGGKLPLHRKMITPRSLSEARQLEKVYESGE